MHGQIQSFFSVGKKGINRLPLFVGGKYIALFSTVLCPYEPVGSSLIPSKSLYTN